jgi:trimeric autotransporter adhesin
MKKVASIILFFIGLASWMLADNYLFIHKSTGVSSIAVTAVDSITFSSDNNYIVVNKTGGTTLTDTINKIDSLTFGDISSKEISIVYSGTTATVTNPYQGHGIDITTSGADVIVKSTITDTEVSYVLSGTASEGSFKIYSNYKYGLILSGVSIANADGPAINIQSGKKCTLTLTAETTNTLADGSSYTKSSEDQKGTLFSEGQIVFQGTGTLNVSGKYKHAIVSDDYISVTAGIINVTSASSDAIHVGEYYKQSGGTVTLASTGDGIDSEGYISISAGTLNVASTSDDVKAIKSAGYITVTGGTVGVTVSGAQSKGFKAAGITTLSGGDITVNTSGAAVLAASGSGYDPSYCTAIKADSTLNITGGTITLTASGVGGKGISGDKDINITGGTLKVTNSGNGATYTNTLGTIDSYSGTGISGD